MHGHLDICLKGRNRELCTIYPEGKLYVAVKVRLQQLTSRSKGDHRMRQNDKFYHANFPQIDILHLQQASNHWGTNTPLMIRSTASPFTFPPSAWAWNSTSSFPTTGVKGTIRQQVSSRCTNSSCPYSSLRTCSTHLMCSVSTIRTPSSQEYRFSKASPYRRMTSPCQLGPWRQVVARQFHSSRPLRKTSLSASNSLRITANCVRTSLDTRSPTWATRAGSGLSFLLFMVTSILLPACDCRPLLLSLSSDPPIAPGSPPLTAYPVSSYLEYFLRRSLSGEPVRLVSSTDCLLMRRAAQLLLPKYSLRKRKQSSQLMSPSLSRSISPNSCPTASRLGAYLMKEREYWTVLRNSPSSMRRCPPRLQVCWRWSRCRAISPKCCSMQKLTSSSYSITPSPLQSQRKMLFTKYGIQVMLSWRTSTRKALISSSLNYRSSFTSKAMIVSQKSSRTYRASWQDLNSNLYSLAPLGSSRITRRRSSAIQR